MGPGGASPPSSSGGAVARTRTGFHLINGAGIVHPAAPPIDDPGGVDPFNPYHPGQNPGGHPYIPPYFGGGEYGSIYSGFGVGYGPPKPGGPPPGSGGGPPLGGGGGQPPAGTVTAGFGGGSTGAANILGLTPAHDYGVGVDWWSSLFSRLNRRNEARTPTKSVAPIEKAGGHLFRVPGGFKQSREEEIALAKIRRRYAAPPITRRTAR
jgi:hypothetical protein